MIRILHHVDFLGLGGTDRFNAQAELVEDGVAGFVAGRADAADYARAPRTPAADRALRRRMGEAARAKAQGFHASHVAAELAAMYREALSAASPQPKNGESLHR